MNLSKDCFLTKNNGPLGQTQLFTQLNRQIGQRKMNHLKFHLNMRVALEISLTKQSSMEEGQVERSQWLLNSLKRKSNFEHLFTTYSDLTIYNFS